jgi:membrane-bound ClpP family serine protease
MAGAGVAVWAVSTLFFILLGDWILPSEGERLGASLFLLMLLALLLLIGIAVIIRHRFFPERGSATRFGYIATFVGLVFNTFTFWNQKSVFPKFDSFQHQSYAVCIMAGYALMMVVPMLVDRLIKEPLVVVKHDAVQESDSGKHVYHHAEPNE